MGYFTVTDIGGVQIVSEFQEEEIQGSSIENTSVYSMTKPDYEAFRLHIKAINGLIDGFKWVLLPKMEYSRARELVQNDDLSGLLKLHNDYGLSSYDYACCGLDGLKNRFESFLNSTH